MPNLAQRCRVRARGKRAIDGTTVEFREGTRDVSKRVRNNREWFGEARFECHDGNEPNESDRGEVGADGSYRQGERNSVERGGEFCG